ncbi:uncharacterized protein LOC126591192 [Malus sylvestris]|uniref:uncharacterized protein LOC126591192 n=1 Tax=Malus sylvestris TaxID=3752 RepID=UPI0021AD0F11|nr:uncharacterized protein LOC126591192 [Malus sylvestris]
MELLQSIERRTIHASMFILVTRKQHTSRAYTPYIHAMPSQEFWPPTNHQFVAPPKYHKQAGRPKKVRAREQDDPQPPSTLNKLPKCFSKVTYGMCGKKGHNRITCGKKQRQASQHAIGGNMGSETPPNQGQEQSASNVSKRGRVKQNGRGKSVHNSRKSPENRRI